MWCDTTYQMSYQSPSCQVQCLSCWRSEPQYWQSREPPSDWQPMHPHHHWAAKCTWECVLARERERSRKWVFCTILEKYPKRSHLLPRFMCYLHFTLSHVQYIPHLDPVWISLLNSSSSPLLILWGLRLYTVKHIHTFIAMVTYRPEISGHTILP